MLFFHSSAKSYRFTLIEQRDPPLCDVHAKRKSSRSGEKRKREWNMLIGAGTREWKMGKMADGGAVGNKRKLTKDEPPFAVAEDPGGVADGFVGIAASETSQRVTVGAFDAAHAHCRTRTSSNSGGFAFFDKALADNSVSSLRIVNALLVVGPPIGAQFRYSSVVRPSDRRLLTKILLLSPSRPFFFRQDVGRGRKEDKERRLHTSSH